MRVCFIEDGERNGRTQTWTAGAIRYFLNAGVDVTVLAPESGWLAPRAMAEGARVVTYDFRDVTAGGDEERTVWGAALRDADAAICTIGPSRDGYHASRFAASVIEEFALPAVLVPLTGAASPDHPRAVYLPPEPIRSGLVTTTRFTGDRLAEEAGVPAEGMTLVRRGVDVDTFTPCGARREEAARRVPLPRGAAPVLGSVVPAGGEDELNLLLRAVAEIGETCPDVHLLLTGEGAVEEELTAAAERMGLFARVTPYPFTDDPVAFYELIDLFLFAGRSDRALPEEILEAMAMERPVAASRSGAIPEVVRNDETGFLVEPGKARAVALTTVKLWSDGEARGVMTANARHLVETAFDRKRQYGLLIDHLAGLSQKAVARRETAGIGS